MPFELRVAKSFLTQNGLTSDSVKGKGERHLVYASVWPLRVLSHFCLYFHSYLRSGPNYCFNMICNMHFQYRRSAKRELFVLYGNRGISRYDIEPLQTLVSL